MRHLETCDFCNAELLLLAHYTAPVHSDLRPCEIPTNLRILAESVLKEKHQAPRAQGDPSFEPSEATISDV